MAAIFCFHSSRKSQITPLELQRTASAQRMIARMASFNFRIPRWVTILQQKKRKLSNHLTIQIQLTCLTLQGPKEPSRVPISRQMRSNMSSYQLRAKKMALEHELWWEILWMSHNRLQRSPSSSENTIIWVARMVDEYLRASKNRRICLLNRLIHKRHCYKAIKQSKTQDGWL